MNHSPEKTIKVGVGIMIMKENKVLLGQRKGAHGEGEYAFPGGHMEYMEGFVGTARRETEEETGIKIKNIQFLYLANLVQYAPKHYVHIGLIADWDSGEPEIREPDRIESWDWYNLDDLPSPLFETCIQSIEAHKTGKNFFDV